MPDRHNDYLESETLTDNILQFESETLTDIILNFESETLTDDTFSFIDQDYYLPKIPQIRGKDYGDKESSPLSLHENEEILSSQRDRPKSATSKYNVENNKKTKQNTANSVNDPRKNIPSDNGIKPFLNIANSLNHLGEKTLEKEKTKSFSNSTNSSKQIENQEVNGKRKLHLNIANSLNHLGTEKRDTENENNNCNGTDTEKDENNKSSSFSRSTSTYSMNTSKSSKNEEDENNQFQVNGKRKLHLNIANSLNHLGTEKGDTEFSRSASTHSMNTSKSSKNEEDENNQFHFFTHEFHTVMYSNVDQSLTNKMSELLGTIEKHKPSIIMLTEIEPKFKKDQTKQVRDSEIAIPNYILFTNQNKKRGVAMYIEKSLDPRECTNTINKGFEECVFCEFNGKNQEKVLLGCMYKSPNSSKQNVEKMIDTLKNLSTEDYDIICIAGDFNYPKIQWEGGGIETGENFVFVECLKDAYLEQKVVKPTRNVRLDQKANIVDLVLINDDKMISEIVHNAPIGNSDHDVLFFQLNMSKKKKKDTEIKRFNLGKGDYKGMKKEIGKTDWSVLEKMNVENQWEFIKEKIVSNMEKFIPQTKQKSEFKTKPCWMNNKIFRKIKKKYHAYKRYLVSKEGKDYEKYIKRRNECTREIRKAKKKHEQNIANDSKNNPTKFWKYVNEKCKTNVGISSLKSKDGSLIDTDKGKAEVLNEFFTSVFLNEDTTNLPKVAEGSFSNGKLIQDIMIDEKIVEKRLKELNAQKAQGPDKIPPRVLKELHKELAKPLCILFKKSLESGKIPNEWKHAEVTAIFKKGNKTDPGNYRPVSLTCICCKLLEQFVRDKIVEHMTDNNLYSNCQHGFRKKRSCITQLLEVYDRLTEMIDDGKSVDIIYLDFKKAFDSIPHERLLLKMGGYGISGNTLNWVRDFLSNRK